ncbi:MAG: FAD-binding oxidoreductase [Bowdeniella nasicola]|nr:FAD-binding oxidoreductase [Bowdeniella nasicola]
MASVASGSKVAVIGAGLIGLSTAFYLQEAGYDVIVVERDQIGSGASRGNAGEITPLTAVPLAGPGMIGETFRGLISRDGPLTLSPLRAMRLMTFGFGFMRSSSPQRTIVGVDAMYQLGKGAIAAFKELEAAGTNIGGGGQGFLYTASDNAVVEKFHAMLSDRARSGVSPKPGALHYGADLHELEPLLSHNCDAGFIDHGAFWLDPALFVESLGEVLAKRGVTFMEGARVSGLQAGAKPVVDYLYRGSRHRLQVDHVVMAAGAWSQELIKPYGVHLGVVPGKGYSFTVEVDRIPEHLVHLADARVVLVPMSGRLRVVGAMEIDGSYETFHPDRITMIERYAAPLVQGVNWKQRSDEWVGPRPMTADGLPIIGTHRKLPGITLATGHNMHGLSLGPVTGKVVANLLQGTDTVVGGKKVNVDKFSPQRLKRLLS